MNKRIKRIKELAEQAGLKQGEWSGHPPVWMETLDSPGGLEKFAKLIIEECSLVCKMNPHFDNYQLANIIKIHFGVEE